MGDLTIETAAVCVTNVEWSTEVTGSKGNTYTVRFCYQPGGRVQYDYECTCPSFSKRRMRCKHIRHVVEQHLRCAWNFELEPGREAPNERCPQCARPVRYLRVGV